MKQQSSLLVLLPFFLIHSFFYGSSAQLWSSCSSSTYSAGSTYSKSLNELASTLAKASSSSLYLFATSTSIPTAYGMFQCRADVSLQDCNLCVNTTMGSVRQQQCPTSKGAYILQDFCHIIYDNSSSLFGVSNMNVLLSSCNTEQNSEERFLSDSLMVLQEVTRLAPNNVNKYAATQHGLAYALAQCDGYLSMVQCTTCLYNFLDVRSFCSEAKGGRVYYGNCYYRFEEYDFYFNSSISPSPAPSNFHSLAVPTPYFNSSISPSPAPSNFHSLAVPTPTVPFISAGAIAGVTVAAILLLCLSLIFLLFYCRRKKHRAPIKGLRTGHDLTPFISPAVVFSYEELQGATHDFHPHNKLGQGGFGPVYKGKLADGREVAIKKLSTTSRQGEREFMSEVSIITSVQHRNLIKLLGCCVEASERLLVYEYLPNKSLDQFLFRTDNGDSNNDVVNWSTRFDMVLGIARGLAYLHQDSQVRIIHRDIKPGNILLDHDLVPKIADFGLARLFSDEISHITTKAAGTIGYLSPEYAVSGQLTEKVDVYSFGMVALEIVSGRRNIDFTQPEEKQVLMYWAWNCYCKGGDELQAQVLDPRLSNSNPPIEEVVRVIHVALLCVQSSAIERPSMSKVIQLLSGQIQIEETPNMPPYLVSSNHNHPYPILDSTCNNIQVPVTHDAHGNFLSGSETGSQVVGR